MDPQQRAKVSQFIRNIIAPGGRAFISHELTQTIKDVVVDYPIILRDGIFPLGEFWSARTGDPLRDEKIHRLRMVSKDVYNAFKQGYPICYDDTLVSLYYTLYYLPRNIHKIQFILLELFERGLLPQIIRALDIGTGVGTVPLAVADFMTLLDQTCLLLDVEAPSIDIEFTCLDGSSQNLDFFDKLTSRFKVNGRSVHVNPLLVNVDQSGDWLRLLPSNDSYDLIFFSNFLTELTSLNPSDRATLVTSVTPKLAPSGLLTIIEPADRANSETYHLIQHELTKNGLTLNFPCTHIQTNKGDCSCSNCWAYRSEKLRVPDFLKPLIWSPAKLDTEEDSIQWCYGIFSHNAILNSEPLTPLCLLDSLHERVNVTAQVISPPINRDRLYKICGSEGRSDEAILNVADYQVLPPITYGDIIKLKDVRVSRNTTQLPGSIELKFDTLSNFENVSTNQPNLDRVIINEPEKKTHVLRYFLQRLFGFDDFRPGQIQVINKVLTGHDVLGVMATSAGKSLCFQLPAMLLPGVAIVVAPLLSLVQDQLVNLKLFGFNHVRRINSELSSVEREEVLDRLIQGYYKLVYITPEQLMNERVILKLQEAARKQGISVIAVDEVHCLSQWGHDFRPAYLNLRRHFSEIDSASGRKTPLLALTATASDYVINDVLTNLEMPKNALQRHSFDRPELSFEVAKIPPSSNRIDALLRILNENLQQVLSKSTRPGIIFVPYTGENIDPDSSWWIYSAEGLAEELRKQGFQVACYHSDLDFHEREERQQAFKDGKIDVLVATKGFGMGIDKGDIRFIIHFSMPDSLESYYQQAGRSGRDNQHAHCVLLFENPDSRRTIDNSYRTDYDRQMYFVEVNYPNIPEEISKVWDYLRSNPTPERSPRGKLIYQKRNHMIVELGWMSAQDMEIASRESEDKSFRENLIREWKILLEMLLGKTNAHAKAKSIGKVKDAERRVSKEDWTRLLYKITTSYERETLNQKLGAMFTPNKLAAIADILGREPNRNLIKQKSECEKKLHVILDALRRMKFIYSWGFVETIANCYRKLSWEEIELHSRDPLVLNYISRVRASNVSNPEAVIGAPEELFRSVNLIELSFKYNLDVKQIHEVYDYLKQLNLLKSLKYSNKQLIIRLDEDILNLSDEEIDEKLEESIRLLYQRKQREIDTLDSMQRYIDTSSCRRQTIVGYFLQQAQQQIIVRCNFCDNCCPDGIKGELANVEQATRRQAEIIDQIQAWLELDLNSASVNVPDEVKGSSNFVKTLQPQEGETQIWDLVNSMCAFHLENRYIDSLRALLLMLMMDFIQRDYVNGEQRLERLKTLLQDQWIELESIAKALSQYPNQYFSVKLNYEAARHLNRPLENQKGLLDQLIEIDYDRNPDYLDQLGRIELQTGRSGYENHFKDALIGWIRNGEIHKTTQRISELLQDFPTCKDQLSDWVEIIASTSPTQSLNLLQILVQNSASALDTEISTSLARIEPILAKSPELLLEAADIARQLADIALVEKYMKQVVNQSGSNTKPDLIHRAHAGLVSIYAPDTILADPAAFKLHLLGSARTAPDEATALDYYKQMVEWWDQENLDSELEWIEDYFSSAQLPGLLVGEYLKKHKLSDEDICEMVQKHNRFRSWPLNTIMRILDQVSIERYTIYPELGLFWLSNQNRKDISLLDKSSFIELCIFYCLQGNELPENSAYLLGKLLFQEMAASEIINVRRIFIQKQNAQLLLNTLTPHYFPETAKSIIRWFNWFPPSSIEYTQDIANKVLQAVEEHIPELSQEPQSIKDRIRDESSLLISLLLNDPETATIVLNMKMSLSKL